MLPQRLLVVAVLGLLPQFGDSCCSAWASEEKAPNGAALGAESRATNAEETNRPSAYQFLQKDKNVVIPGIVFLDDEGAVKDTSGLDSAKQLAEKMNEVAK